MTEVTEDGNMVAIPPPSMQPGDLERWYVVQADLKKLKDEEMALRKRIFNHYFPEPKEGTNTAPLADGWQLKGKYALNRDVDEGAFKANAERFRQALINPDEVVKFRLSLSVSAYKELTAEQQHLFDQCLIIKPGSPALEIVLPAKAKKAAAAQAAPSAIVVTPNGEIAS